MEIKIVKTRIYLDERILERNFSFEIFNSINSLTNRAYIMLRKDYFFANNINVNERKITISMQINNENEKKVFSGKVTNIKENKTDFIIEAENNIELYGSFVRTYENVSIDVILKEITKVELDITDEIKNIHLKRIILTKTRKEAFENIIKTLSTLLKKPVYYYLKNNKIFITTEPKGKIYDVNESVFKIGLRSLNIFPIPELQLGDTLQYMGKSLKVGYIKMNERFFLCENGPLLR